MEAMQAMFEQQMAEMAARLNQATVDSKPGAKPDGAGGSSSQDTVGEGRPDDKPP